MGAWDRDGSAGSPAGHARSGQAAVITHSRPRFWRSVRVRILLPVILASAGVLVLGAVQVEDAVNRAAHADRSSRLARAAGDIGALAHNLALEYVAHNEALRAGTGPDGPSAQEAATDQALTAFRRTSQQIRTVEPELARITDAADRALASLSSARALARQSPDGAAEVLAFYEQMIRSVLSLADALPARMTEKRLIELSRSVSLLGELHHLAALQHDVVARGLGQRSLEPRDSIRLAELVGGERKQVEAIANLDPAGRLYAALTSEARVARATGIRQVILDGRGSPASLALDLETWTEAQTLRMQGLWAIEQQVSGQLVTEADEAGSAAREQSYLVGFLASAVLAVTLIGATVIAVRLSRRLRHTRYAALTAARVELPNAISHVIAARDADSVRAALADSSQRIDSMLTAGPDEIGELSTAFGAVHRQALRLAADQALLRMEVQAMFVALSRRGQTLVQRQIHLIDEFGRHEADPDALERLFALDHLAARMRRNEENLLVLAGGEPGRWITRPVALVDLVRAAAQEIEEYRRVELADVPAVAVSANVAGDAIHLLAELLENATSFSPPNTPVRVAAGRTVDGLIISVVDSGIGMPESRLFEANERLAHPSMLTSSLVGTMGLLVVARLAQRHGIQVRLESIPAAGTAATVTLPDRLVVPLSMVDQLQPGRWLREIGVGSAQAPAPAVTSLPRMALPNGSQAGQRSGQPTGGQPASGQPTVPASGRPTVGQPSAERPLMDRPVSGAPAQVGLVPMQRRPAPGEAGWDQGRYLDRPADDDNAATAPTTPDPELVRARLSSLAHGIAAAQQGDAAPPPPVHQSR